MLAKAFDRLALIFCVLAPFAAAGWFVAPYDLGAQAGPLRFSLYCVYTLAVWRLTMFYRRLLMRNPDGLAYVWAVVAFYVEAFFAVALVGILFIIGLRWIHPEAGPVESELILRTSYALIGMAATNTAVAALVADVGERTKLLNRRIPWHPFGRKKRVK